MGTEIKVGDVWLSTWGYDQTNATFVRIEKVAGEWVTVREVETVNSWKENMVGTAVPGTKLGKTFKRKWKAGYQGTPVIKLEKWGMYASPWSGNPVNVSCYA